MSGLIDALPRTKPHQDIEHQNPMNNDRSAAHRLRSRQRQIAEYPAKNEIQENR